MKILRNTAWRTISLALLVATLLALGLHTPALRGGDQAMPTVNTAAPDFTLNSQEGTPVSLHDYRGKWVVLYFYPKDMTPGCTIEAHGFQRDLEKYRQNNTVILGVSVDSVDSHKQFCSRDRLNFKLLSDEKHEVVSQYGSLNSFGIFTVATRNTFLIDPEGKIVKEFLKVDPQGHSAEVLAALALAQKEETNW